MNTNRCVVEMCASEQWCGQKMSWWQRSRPHEEGRGEHARRERGNGGETEEDKKGLLKFLSAEALQDHQALHRVGIVVQLYHIGRERYDPVAPPDEGPSRR